MPPPPPPFLRSRAHIFKCRLSFKRLPYYLKARNRLFQNRQCITLSQMNEGIVSKETVVFRRWGIECRLASAGRLSRSWRFRENRFAPTKGQRLKNISLRSWRDKQVSAKTILAMEPREEPSGTRYRRLIPRLCKRQLLYLLTVVFFLRNAG